VVALQISAGRFLVPVALVAGLALKHLGATDEPQTVRPGPLSQAVMEFSWCDLADVRCAAAQSRAPRRVLVGHARLPVLPRADARSGGEAASMESLSCCLRGLRAGLPVVQVNDILQRRKVRPGQAPMSTLQAGLSLLNPTKDEAPAVRGEARL
jgi:hypothetical protein